MFYFLVNVKRKQYRNNEFSQYKVLTLNFPKNIISSFLLKNDSKLFEKNTNLEILCQHFILEELSSFGDWEITEMNEMPERLLSLGFPFSTHVRVARKKRFSSRLI